MKKQVWYGVLVTLVIVSNGIYAHKDEDSLKTDPAYIKATDTVRLLKESFVAAQRGAKRGARIGAGAGALIGIVTTPSVRERAFQKLQETKGPKAKKPSLLRAAVASVTVHAGGYAAGGAVVGAAISETKRRYTLWNINSALQAHEVDNFMKLSLNESVMVVAAYQKDLSLMEKVKPHVHHFFHKAGVWQALAQLYFGVARPDTVEKLKEIIAK